MVSPFDILFKFSLDYPYVYHAKHIQCYIKLIILLLYNTVKYGSADFYGRAYFLPTKFFRP